MGILLLISLLLPTPARAERGDGADRGSTSPYARWERGLPADPGFFPIAVWL